MHYSIQMANIVMLTGGRDTGSANGSRIRGRNTCLAPGAGNPCYATATISGLPLFYFRYVISKLVSIKRRHLRGLKHISKIHLIVT